MWKKLMENPTLQTQFFGSSVLDYMIFAALFVVGFIFITFINMIVSKHLKKKNKELSSDLYDYIAKIQSKLIVPLAYYGLFYFSISILQLPASAAKGFKVIGIVLLTYCITRFIILVITYVIDHKLGTLKPTKVSETTLKGLFPAIKIIVWLIALLFLLSNLGFNISTLLAGLGIGGMALALASQNILTDLFSYFSILIDKPFAIGDFIIIDSYMGSIEHIGIKTTRIRSLSGEQLVFGNTDLTKARLKNYKRMEKRRVSFSIGVTYDTPNTQLKKIPDMIKSIYEKYEDIQFDRCHFKTFEESSLKFETVYHMLTSDYQRYMDIQQEANLTLKEQFEKQKIDFAFPTQSIILEKS